MSLYYRLGDLPRIPKNADLNSYLDPGNYCCNLNDTVKTLKNCPTGGEAFTMRVYYANGDAPYNGYIYINQKITSYRNGEIYIRVYMGAPLTGQTWHTYKIQSSLIS